MNAPHFFHVFATFVPGGPQVRTAALMNALGSRVRHTVMPMDGRSEARELLSADVPIEIVPPPPRAGMLTTVRALRRELVERRPDLLLTYNWGSIEMGMAARTRRGLPHVHHEDGFLPDEAAGFKRRRTWFRRGVLRGADAVIVPSNVLASIARDLWHIGDERLRLIPNGIDLSRFAPESEPGARGSTDPGPPPNRAAVRERLGIAPGATVIGYVGHLRPEKNPLRLLQAALHVPASARAELLILGDGPERAGLEAFLQGPGRNLKVHLAGHQSDPLEYYRAMDLFGISSNTEQMPVALVEAMACGLPVASTDVGDVAHMLPAEGRRFVVPLQAGAGAEERTAQALGEALAALIADAPARARLGSAGRERVLRDYDFDAMFRAHVGCFERALGRRLPPSDAPTAG